MAFYLRFFTYFKINSLSSLVESYKASLRIKEVFEQENNLNLVNSLAIKYSRSLIVESNSLDLTTSRKHRRQASSISSSNPRVTKKTKTLDLVNLSSSSNSNLILSSILKEFL